MTRRFQHRSKELRSSLHRFSSGNWNTRLPVSSTRDDIDDFSIAVNEMLGRLQSLMQAMGQVSSDIAHDLKMPIGRLLMATEEALAAAEKDNRAQTPYLREIGAEARKISSTFEGLLSISQIEGGARKERFQSVNLAELVLSIAEFYSPVAEDVGSSLQLCQSSDQCQVLGDSDLLNRMLANLVENAIRHSPKGSQIEIGVNANNGCALLFVSDDGSGIPESEREKVLRRLYRLEKSRTTPGSGLGLSLVKAIVELHNAKLFLSDNKPGLKVLIELPMRNATQQT